MALNASVDRRSFVKTASVAGVGVLASGGVSPFGSFRLGGAPNEKVVVAVMGLNGRGSVLAPSFARSVNTEVAYVCDVDERVLAKGLADVSVVQRKPPKSIGDFRRALDDKSVDALVIAAPDHWHAPAALLALQAGKHVYVEKPCGHNPREGEMLVEAQRRYDRRVQMGSQQRSGPRSIEVIREIAAGAIGRPYLARCWYSNTRGAIGTGKPAPVPAWLNYELWQGPAPRTPYRDNVIHYNWHWFARWGTGEICNNGTHEIDVCRWALGVDYPVRVTSAGGRYHFHDDWEFPDTQEVSFEFDGNKAIVWQGQSCNGFALQGRGRGSSIHGTDGTVVLDRSGYTVYNLKNKVVKESTGDEKGDGLDPRSAEHLTDLHIANFVDAVRTGAKLHAPIDEGHKSVLLCHLGNIAQRTGRALRTDPRNGHIVGDDDAMKMWGREYAAGWAPAV
ncbi:MAG: Gfo/Idh/MocA family oxidoreductase [Gemmatimonadaceae bacterium]